MSDTPKRHNIIVVYKKGNKYKMGKMNVEIGKEKDSVRVLELFKDIEIITYFNKNIKAAIPWQ